MDKVFIVEYEGRTIGVWNNLESAQFFIKGCQQSGLMKSSGYIKTYGINTCYCLDTQQINLQDTTPTLTHPKVKFEMKEESKLVSNDIIQTKSENITVNKNETKPNPNVNLNNPAMIEMAKQKVELQHKINMLKQQKKKIEESKMSYANDIKLFELFTQSKQKDPNFVIPEIFTKKFDIMTKLSNDDKLSWDNFVKEYQHENMYNEHFGLNTYEEMFLESDEENKSDISEELDIETDSSTDTSDEEN